MSEIKFKDGDIGWKNSDVLWDKKETVTTTSQLDALIKQSGITQTASADALILKRQSSTAGLNALLKKVFRANGSVLVTPIDYELQL